MADMLGDILIPDIMNGRFNVQTPSETNIELYCSLYIV